MEGQEYLNQIAADMRPQKANTKSGILHSKFFIVGMIGVVGLILIMILGAILGGGKGGVKEKSMELMLHLDGTAEVIQEYQPNVKSSELRSSSASLYAVLTNTSRELETYLTEEQDFSATKTMEAEAEANAEALGEELFAAKINGLLDRTFAHKMTYEISLLMNEEAAIAKSNTNETLAQILDKSYDSLNVLYEKFNNFSEGK